LPGLVAGVDDNKIDNQLREMIVYCNVMVGFDGLPGIRPCGYERREERMRPES
jgi:hypothetical protein